MLQKMKSLDLWKLKTLEFLYNVYKKLHLNSWSFLLSFLSKPLDIFQEICYTMFVSKRSPYKTEVLKMKKNPETLKEISNRIDRIKSELWSMASELEEAGYVGKAKSLLTIGSRLEDWQHRR